MRFYTCCILSLLIWSCSSISKPDESGKKLVIPLSETIKNLEAHMALLGTSVDTTVHLEKFQLIQPTATINSYKKIKNGTLTSIDLVLNFESDSTCTYTFNDLKKYLDKSYGVSKGSNTFRSWEYPSKRNFVTACLVDNKSSFYGNPTIEIKLIENDDRYYRK